jgi:hypothetical protein
LLPQFSQQTNLESNMYWVPIATITRSLLSFFDGHFNRYKIIYLQKNPMLSSTQRTKDICRLRLLPHFSQQTNLESNMYRVLIATITRSLLSFFDGHFNRYKILYLQSNPMLSSTQRTKDISRLRSVKIHPYHSLLLSKICSHAVVRDVFASLQISSDALLRITFASEA